MCKVILVSLLVFEGEVILDGFEGLIPVESVADRFSPVCLSMITDPGHTLGQRALGSLACQPVS